MNLFILCAMVLNSIIPSAQVISDNYTSTTIEFNLPEYTIENIVIDGKLYDKVVVPGAITYLEKGLPELPRLYQSVIISDDGEYAYQTLSAIYETLKVNTILSSKGNLTRDINPDLIPYEFSSFYDENRYFPDNNINISEPFIIRDFRGLTVHFNPFQFNPALNQLIVCKRFQVQIYKAQSGGANLKIRNNNTITVTREFKDLYQNFFLNFSSTRYDSIQERAGRMLIIVGDQFYTNILPFATWKQMKGIPVKIKKYSEIGVGYTAVKNYIQSEYNLGNLVWILIVGDSADVPPAKTVGVTSASSDPVYTYLNGTDYYPDAFISRFSGNTTADIDNQVNRTITYERTLVTGDGWERKGTGIASTESGTTPYADSTRANWLRNMLLNYNYTSVDKIYDPSANTSMVAAAINDGRSIVNYIGHGTNTSWGSSGFSNTNVNQLNNINKLPFIISVACVNGNFGGLTCFAEAWLRAGTPANPTGAIAFYGSTINQSWVPPTVAQSAACSLLVQNRNNTIGGLMFNGSCHMIAAYLPATDGVKEFQCWHIFGDASVQVRNLSPQPMTVTHQGALPIGMSSINVSVLGVQNALIGIFKDTTLYGSGYTDATGNVTINFSEPMSTMGNVKITVSAYNKVTYLESIPVIVPNAPYVMYLKNQITDPLPGGNNNNMINPGEEITMNIWLKNFGGVTATNVRAWLRTTDPNITITDSFKSFGNIPANDSVMTTTGYKFNVSPNLANGYNLVFSLAIKDNADSTWRSSIVLPVAQCEISHTSTQVIDTAYGGNNNAIINRGETVNLVVSLKNNGAAAAENTQVTLSTTTPYITIIDGSSNFGAINPNTTVVNNNDPFTIFADSLIVPGTMAQFRIIVTSGVYIETLYFSLPIEIYLQDFEANNGSYEPAPTTGAWEWGVSTSGPGSAHSGTKLWATVLGGNYGVNSANWTLTSPEFTATGDTPTLKFWHWYSFEGTSTLYDCGNVKISTNNGGIWTVATPVGGYTGTGYSSTPGVGGQPVYGGSSNGWVEAVFNLPVTAGQTFKIRWHFGSDAAINSYPGWYIDDVTGIGFAVLPPPNNDVGVDMILSPGSNHWPNTEMTPSALVKNYGALTQVNIPVTCSIVGPGSVLRYTGSANVASLNSGDTVRVNFASWTPTQIEMCTVKMRTNLAGDAFPVNDRKVQTTSISQTSQIIVGTATTNAYAGPMNRYYNYSGHEAIYLQPEINVNGLITHIAYYKNSGSDVNPIEAVTIYLKHTTEQTLATGTYSTTGYTEVFNGSFTNNATEGWMEVALTTPFIYNNTDNLAVLIVKGYQAYISYTICPYWRYTATTAYRTRQAQSDASQPISLTQTYNRANIRLTLSGMAIEEPINLNQLPLITALYAPKPNPVTNGIARISYSLSEPTKVKLTVYDASGRVVKTLVNTQMESGIYNLTWNGRDANNRAVAEGIYFYTLETPKYNATKKMVYTK